MPTTPCLITGITGMVDSHLADRLSAGTGWYANGICRWRSPKGNFAYHAPRINAGDRLRLLNGDLRDRPLAPLGWSE